jgi:hypothetical protein
MYFKYVFLKAFWSMINAAYAKQYWLDLGCKNNFTHLLCLQPHLYFTYGVS